MRLDKVYRVRLTHPRFARQLVLLGRFFPRLVMNTASFAVAVHHVLQDRDAADYTLATAFVLFSRTDRATGLGHELLLENMCMGQLAARLFFA